MRGVIECLGSKSPDISLAPSKSPRWDIRRHGIAEGCSLAASGIGNALFMNRDYKSALAGVPEGHIPCGLALRVWLCELESGFKLAPG